MPPLESGTSQPVPEKHTHLHYLGVTVLVALWQGMIGVLVKWSTWHPISMVWARCVVTVVALGVYSRLHPPMNPGGGDQTTSTRRRHVTWLSGALLAGHWVTLFLGYRVCNVGPVVVALFTFPVMAALVEPWFFRQRPQAVQILTACIATVGVAGMRLWDGPQTSVEANTSLGIGLGLCSAAFFTARSIIARRLLRHSSAIQIMHEQATVVAVLLLPSTLLLGWTELTLREFGLMLVLGAGFTAIPHTLGVWAMKRLTVATSGVVGSLQTVSTLVLAQALVGESISVGVWLGAAAVVFAVALESVAHARA